MHVHYLFDIPLFSSKVARYLLMKYMQHDMSSYLMKWIKRKLCDILYILTKNSISMIDWIYIKVYVFRRSNAFRPIATAFLIEIN